MVHFSPRWVAVALLANGFNRKLHASSSEIGQLNITGDDVMMGCREALLDADADASGYVEWDEYPNFLNSLDNNELCITGVDDTPATLMASFDRVSCLCEECCESIPPGINTAGLEDQGDIVEGRNEEQEAYINDICEQTLRALEEYSMMSAGPSVVNTNSPTLQPTNSPTLAPTDLPTVSPTLAPTSIPTAFPTSVPTNVPTTQFPSQKPTTSATISSQTPSPPITQTPTTPETTSETMPTKRTTVPYSIAIPASVQHSDYVSDLIKAMDIVAVNVAAEMGSGRIRGRRRRLDVKVNLPTALLGSLGDVAPSYQDAMQTVECPTVLKQQLSPPMRCENVTASVELSLDDSEQPEVELQLFESALAQAVDSGKLEQSLQDVNSETPVDIIDFRLSELVQSNNNEQEESSDDVIPIGTIIGAGVGGGFVLVLLIGIFVVRSRRKLDGYNDLKIMEPQENCLSLEDALAFQRKEEDDVQRENNVAVRLPSHMMGTSQSSISHDPRSPMGGVLDMSSMGSASVFAASENSFEIHDDDMLPPYIVDDYDKPTDVSGISEMEVALENGDWVAVGTAAQYMATQEHILDSDSSFSSYSHVSSSMQSGKWRERLNSDIVDELDTLINDGNWEGITRAAAKYGAQGVTTNMDARSINSRGSYSESYCSTAFSSDAGSVGSSSRSVDMSGSSSFINTATASRSEATTPNQLRQREDIRKEVVELVTRVVPDEIDHIDEMMQQFKGREEELVETLRTMEERSAVRKARKMTNTIAKLEARETSKENKLNAMATPLPASPPVKEVHTMVDEDDDDANDSIFNNLAARITSSPQKEGMQQPPTSNVNTTDEDAAQDGANDAAEWAIQRSLNKMASENEV